MVILFLFLNFLLMDSLGLGLGGGKLQEDILQAKSDRAQFVQVPAGGDYRARQIRSNVAARQAFYLEHQPSVMSFPRQHAADPAPLFETLLNIARGARSVG